MGLHPRFRRVRREPRWNMGLRSELVRDDRDLPLEEEAEDQFEVEVRNELGEVALGERVGRIRIREQVVVGWRKGRSGEVVVGRKGFQKVDGAVVVDNCRMGYTHHILQRYSEISLIL